MSEPLMVYTVEQDYCTGKIVAETVESAVSIALGEISYLTEDANELEEWVASKDELPTEEQLTQEISKMQYGDKKEFVNGFITVETHFMTQEQLNNLPEHSGC